MKKIILTLISFIFLILSHNLFLKSEEKLGAVVKDNGTLFSIYSENATRIELWIFDNPNTGTPIKRVSLTKGNNNIWRVFVPNVGPGTYYGYRIWGPNWKYDPNWKPGTDIGFICDVDKYGNRFNPNKLLIDPYAKAISHDPKGSGYLTGKNERTIDTALNAPKSIVIDNRFEWEGDRPLNRPLNKTIIYEVHLRGFTRNYNSGVNYVGTYKGVIEKAKYLKNLGITAIEFLPIHETINDQNGLDNDPRDDNYWGYMTLNYFSPDRRYSHDKSPDGPVREFKEMVKELHKMGIEVILDVVFNHTAEGGIAYGDPNCAVLFSFRGIDNQVYYELTNDNKYYWDNTGCGANMRVTHPQVRRFIIDCLKYWVNEMHVDGFRFDLASVLGNIIDKGGYQFSKDSELLKEIAKELPNTKIIAEPWAVGMGTYQVGNFPLIWAEWNGKFRDTVRRFILMEKWTVPELATRISGSSDLYGDDGRKPYHSINFITAHDGFTLYDLVSYDYKNNNQPYPYGPSDGGEDHNNSKNWVYEWLKRQQIRNFACILFLSQGTPMLLGGDEFGRTQKGNNNAYNLDTVCSWLDWSLLEKKQRLWKFFQGIIALRKKYSAFQRTNFFTGKDHDYDNIPDIQWHSNLYLKPDWSENSHVLAFRLDGSQQETGGEKDHGDIYIAINGWREILTFQLPPNHKGKKWYRLIDTANWAEDDLNIQNNIDLLAKFPISDGTWTQLNATTFNGNSSYQYGVHGFSIAVFIEK